MAEMGVRGLAEDFLHSFRFHVRTVSGGYDPLAVDGRPEAGFNSVSTPDLTIESVEYKEGLDIYPQKYPGAPTVSEITLSRGVTWQDTSFWEWARGTVEGDDVYRVNLQIEHYHRQGFLTTPRDQLAQGNIMSRVNSTNTTPARTYMIYQAFPVRHKPAMDMDATSAEISLMELDVAYEYFDVITTNPTG